jgi:hypothetical protein
VYVEGQTVLLRDDLARAQVEAGVTLALEHLILDAQKPT